MITHELLNERVLVLDGAMGTFLQAKPLTAADFGGADYEGCYEHLNLTRPDVLRDIHGAYLQAGANIICTNTFGGTRIVLSEYDLQHKVHAINAAAARLARQAAAEHDTADKPRFAAGSLGPQTKTITVTGGVTFDEVIEAFREQTLGLLDGGIDLLLIETAQDTLNLKATVMGARRAMQEAGRQVPIMISVTIEPMGTMLGGQNVEALYTSIAHVEPLSIGLNCATGPEFMTDHLRSLAGLSSVPVSCHPNAGLPDEEGHYHETPTSLATQLERFIDNGWLHVAGGCCGTTPKHIEVLADMAQSKRPQPPAGRGVSWPSPAWITCLWRPTIARSSSASVPTSSAPSGSATSSAPASSSAPLTSGARRSRAAPKYWTSVWPIPTATSTPTCSTSSNSSPAKCACP